MYPPIHRYSYIYHKNLIDVFFNIYSISSIKQQHTAKCLLLATSTTPTINSKDLKLQEPPKLRDILVRVMPNCSKHQENQKCPSKISTSIRRHQSLRRFLLRPPTMWQRTCRLFAQTVVSFAAQSLLCLTTSSKLLPNHPLSANVNWLTGSNSTTFHSAAHAQRRCATRWMTRSK
jgi:hypothetical protein